METFPKRQTAYKFWAKDLHVGDELFTIDGKIARIVNVKDVNEENGAITIFGPDTKTRGLLIGRDRKNLENLKDVVGRYFTVEDIKVM